MVIYLGFGVGALNTYFFTSYFTPTQFGLTTIFMAVATMMTALAMVAMPSYIYKFYPYYKDHVPLRKNDMLSWALLVGCIGFVMVMIGGWVFKSLVVRKFGEHSPELLQYYYWIFPMGLGLTIYTILESYTWNIGKPVLTSLLKEVAWRLFTTLLIVLFITGLINSFDIFIKLYAFGFPAIALILFVYLVAKKRAFFTFTISNVTRRFFKKIVAFTIFIYSAGIISTISQVIDTIVIASINGTEKAGIFSLAQYLANVIQAPQRGIVAASIPHLSRAWKDKNHGRLQMIYQRSSINLLIFAMGLFLLMSLDYSEAILTFGLRADYLLSFNAFLLLGLMRIVDMGTGLNAQIIGTSNYWRFELISGIVLLLVMIPLTILLTRAYGILGPAIANLISITTYNLIRIIFLWFKFKLFPFTMQSLYTILSGLAAFLLCYYLFRNVHGMAGLVIRSIVFIGLYAGCVIGLRLTPDVQPVMNTVRRRLRI
jgi:O-antigen/teichoic acid export membrane protein